MPSRYVFVVASAMTALTPVLALAKGAPTPAARGHVIATVPPVVTQLPQIELPSADKMLQGCGGHRYRDPATQQCRGF